LSGSGAIKKPVGQAVAFAAPLVLACIMAAGTPASLFAQSVDPLVAGYKSSPNARLLLVSDELVYDNDNQKIIAEGGVQIDYDGNKLVSKKVVYDKRTGRLMAVGNVEIVERDGNRIYAENIDITDDFRDGFVNALRVETVDDTRFAAVSAERSGGSITTFNQGVYTACKPCRDHPEKAPIWQIKSRKIIWNGQKKTVRFEGAHFELFGMPLTTLPAFEIADPTVKRKTGFLIPGIEYKSELGVGLRVPFYVALAPNYDLLLSTTAYSKQGFLGEAEFRKRLDNGIFTLKMAGIHQFRPGKFDVGSVDGAHKNRGMIGSTGQFQINPRWMFGWNAMVQSDKNFSRTYGIDGYADYYRKNEVYLTGFSGRNYLDLHAYKFNVQQDTATSSADDQQPWAGNVDYSWTAPNPVFGGELNYNLNMRAINRSALDSVTIAGPSFGNIVGAAGSSGHILSEVEWKRTLIVPGGLTITPLFDLRGDADLIDTSSLVRSEAFRTMATAGLDVRWPVLFSTTSATHILEPIGQVFARNNERYAGELPNEDAQSLVFDATSLFERDKFSGWDRVEGGTRANIGLRYSGTFANGWSAHALIGQSYHLAGRNSFASKDLVDVGAYSGLETDTSDVVAMAGVTNANGLALALRGRFDEKTFEVRRGETEIAYSGNPFSGALRYAFIQKQPGYGFINDRHEVSANGSVKFNENWRAYSSTTYDIKNKYFASNAIGFGYDDSCTSYSMTYSETKTFDAGTNAISKPKRSIGFNLSFRTLGDFGSGRAIDGQ
jgi:LPS-assembly protein